MRVKPVYQINCERPETENNNNNINIIILIRLVTDAKK